MNNAMTLASPDFASCIERKELAEGPSYKSGSARCLLLSYVAKKIVNRF